MVTQSTLACSIGIYSTWYTWHRWKNIDLLDTMGIYAYIITRDTIQYGKAANVLNICAQHLVKAL